ncbi:MAG TPA: DegT/DnrJ/EryC1/StrS family aminotransferase [Candidatus Methylomirabilis sp.]|nr:DegT/DnrJ/EryC1/StrS family aminotransferase [Candidatus Methylomirabilis sp.]
MEVPFLDLARQYRRIGPEIDAALHGVLERGSYILGNEVAAFERAFASYSGARHAVGVGSGTDAIHLALRACGVRPGDRVITAPNTATPTVCAIVQAGAVPVFVDIDRTTFTLDPGQLRAHLAAQPPSLRPRAVVPVHLYGHPADMPEILKTAAEYDVKVIEDAAQAHGAEYGGRRLGAIADASCWSFYPTKNLGAYGDAGMVVTDDPDVAERVRMLRNYGEEAKYVNRIEGVNSRLDEIQAAVLRVKLGHLDQWVTTRRRLAALYDTLLVEAPVARPTETTLARHCYHLYVIRSRHRDALRQHLLERGIGTAIHYPLPVYRQAAYRHLVPADREFPCAESACREVLSLPLYPELTEEELRHVAAAVCAFRG